MRFYKHLAILFIALLQFSCSTTKPLLRVGLVADPQYADQPTVGKRYYRESVWKLQQAVDTFNNQKIDFVQTLGDVIDKEWASYDSILPVYQHLNPSIESYQSLGNHDFSIDSVHMPRLLGRLGMSSYYYSYVRKGFRFVVLDATDYAYYSNPLHQRPVDALNEHYKRTEGQPNHYEWNSGIGEEQQAWLRQEIAQASSAGQKVILFSHMPIRPEGGAHNLWNATEILTIIEGNPNVVAFVNGHNHAGGYVFKNGIHYITIFGMVDTEISSYAILNIYRDRLVLNGYGNQKSLELKMK